MSPVTALLVLLGATLVLTQAPVTYRSTTPPPPLRRHFNILTIATLAAGQVDGHPEVPSSAARESPVTRQSGANCQNIRYPATAVGQTALIRSPNWPNAYPTDQDCSYFVTSPINTQITLACDVNIVCASPNDYIFWSLSGDPTFGDAQGYCGLGRVATQTSQGNSLSIGFNSESGQRPTSRFTYRWQCRIRIIQARPPPATTTTVRPPPITGRPPQISTTVAPVIPPGATNCSCGVRNLRGGRIVGGTETQTNELPWRVSVFVYTVQSLSGGLCGGTVISPNWIMTAAHCTMNFQNDGSMNISVFTEAQNNPVTVGGGVEIMVDRFVQHPGFSRQNFDNDITLLHLSRPITYSAKVSPVCLPQGPLATSDYNGFRVLASGWGTTRPVPAGAQNSDPVSSTLLEVELPVLTTDQCRQYQSLTNNQFCTYAPGKDTCQGDSGGSIDYQYLNNRYYAIGVTSFGYGCAQVNYPGAYTKVNNYLSWMQSQTRETFCLPSS